MAFLAVDDLQVAFGERTVLDGLSFEVGAGEVYGLVGPNGAGKSTTINVICDVLVARRGSVSIDGRSHVDVRRQALGVVPQDIALYRDLTARQNLEFFAAVYGLTPRVRRDRAARNLDAVGLSERAESRVSELSGGMQRRLHLAASLLHDPPLLILDEPTVGLDLEIRQRIWSLIVDLKRSGVAILLTTHHLDEAETLCDRMGIIDRGRVVAEGALEDLRGRIPAVELAEVGSEDLEVVRARAAQLGMTSREGHDSVVLWLPERMDLKRVAERFEEIPLSFVRIRPIGLADIMSEVVTGHA